MKIKCYCGHTDYCDCGPLSVPKEEQKQLLTEIMEADAKDGLYKQMTAVEWLVDRISIYIMDDKALPLIEQAKQIEKEQIIKAVDSNFEYSNSGYPTLGEQYYNKIYNK